MLKPSVRMFSPRETTAKFSKSILAVAAFIFSVGLGFLWTIVYFNLSDSKRTLWLLLYEPLKLTVKLYAFAPIIAMVNDEHWFVMTLSVDVFFTTFLVTMLQFESSFNTTVSVSRAPNDYTSNGKERSQRSCIPME